MLVTAVVAMSQNRVIGKDNQLPWHMPADLKHFKALTMGKPILMGRKTFQSIGKSLPGRLNIILTRDQTFQALDCSVVHSVDEAFRLCKDKAELCVIGGAELFIQMLPVIERIYLTVIHAEFAGDVFFPDLNLSEWKLENTAINQADEKNPFSYSFMTYNRI